MGNMPPQLLNPRSSKMKFTLVSTDFGKIQSPIKMVTTDFQAILKRLGEADFTETSSNHSWARLSTHLRKTETIVYSRFGSLYKHRVSRGHFPKCLDTNLNPTGGRIKEIRKLGDSPPTLRSWGLVKGMRTIKEMTQ